MPALRAVHIRPRRLSAPPGTPPPHRARAALLGPSVVALAALGSLVLGLAVPTQAVAAPSPAQAEAVASTTPALAAATGTEAPPPPPDLAPAAGVLFGASVARGTYPLTEDAVTAYEQRLGRRLDAHRWYSRWDEPMPPNPVRTSVDEGRTPVLSIEPRLRDGTRLSWASIARGDHDARIRTQAAAIGGLGVPLFLTFHHEPEFAATHGTPTEFRAAWRHYVEVFRAAGVRNVVWTWVVTPTVFYAAPATATADQLYPGDDVVDWLGLDAYNWYGCTTGVPTAWRTMAQIAAPFREFGRAHGKPLMLAEWGSAEDPADPSRKASWLRDSMTTLTGWPEMKAVLYFDHHGSCPWWSDSTTASLTAFRDIAALPGAHGRTTAWLRPTTVLGAAPLSVGFDGSSSTGAGAATGAGIATWSFEAGDGSAARSGVGRPPATLGHTYAAGTYQALLRVTDSAGRSATDTVTITSAKPPTIDAAARAITADSADLTAWANLDNLTGTVRFEWGTTTSYGSTATVAVPAVPYTKTVVQRVTGLRAGTTYHLRVTATSAAGSAVRTRTFSTAGAPTTSATWTKATTTTTTVLAALVHPRQLATTVWFEWGTTAALGSRTAAVAVAALGYEKTVEVPLTGLSPGVTYHLRVVAQNAMGTVSGPVRTVTTSR